MRHDLHKIFLQFLIEADDVSAYGSGKTDEQRYKSWVNAIRARCCGKKISIKKFWAWWDRNCGVEYEFNGKKVIV